MPVYMSKSIVLETQGGSKNITMVYKCQYSLEETIWEFVAQLIGSSLGPSTGLDDLGSDDLGCVTSLSQASFLTKESVRTAVNGGAGG